jgi:hypothetical protein
MSTLMEAPAAAPKDPQPVTLRSLHDYALTTKALEVRAEELKKLAEKNSKEGYTREARAVLADASSIETQILPCFKQQRELPLVSHDDLEKEITGALRRVLTKAFEGLGDPKQPATPESVAYRRDQALKALAARVTLFATEVADHSFNQGFAAREQTSEALTMRFVQTLRAVD